MSLQISEVGNISIDNTINLHCRLERKKRKLNHGARIIKLCRIEASGFRRSFSALYLKLCYCYCPTFAGHMGQGLAIREKIISTGHELEISSWGMDPISNQSGGKESLVCSLITQIAFLVCQKQFELTIQKNTCCLNKNKAVLFWLFP